MIGNNVHDVYAVRPATCACFTVLSYYQILKQRLDQITVNHSICLQVITPTDCCVSLDLLMAYYKQTVVGIESQVMRLNGNVFVSW